MPPEITQEIVVAAMAAVEEETVRRAVAICRAYYEKHNRPGSRIASAKAGTAAELAKVVMNMERKSR